MHDHLEVDSDEMKDTPKEDKPLVYTLSPTSSSKCVHYTKVPLCNMHIGVNLCGFRMIHMKIFTRVS